MSFDFFKKKIFPWLGLLLFFAALWIMHRALSAHRLPDIRQELEALPRVRVALAIGLTAVSYLVATLYDHLGIAYLKHPLPWKNITTASFISYAFSNNIGLSVLTSGTVRYRFYSAWGLSGEEITRLIAFTTTTFWLGLFFTGSSLFLMEPLALPFSRHLPFHSAQPIGILFAVLVALYLLWVVRNPGPLTVGAWRFSLPGIRLALLQLLTGALDWILSAGVLVLLIPATAGLSWLHLLGIYLMAQTAALISHVPGGLGVFESMVLLAAPGLPAPALIGALLAYRGIYYLLPLATAVLLIGAYELVQRRADVIHATRGVVNWVFPLVPPIMAMGALVAGAILLFSNATPAVPARLNWLKDIIPLGILETSHFLGSIIGAMLLLIGRGLQRRLDGAWVMTVLLLATGITVSLLKGIDYEEAMLLSILLAGLMITRRQFYRRSSLIGESLTVGWTATIILIMSATVWLGFFSYRHVDYSSELWWQFAFHHEAPRFLRTLVGSLAVMLVFALSRLLSPPKDQPQPPPAKELDQAGVIIENSPQTAACLVLLGDKRLLFNAGGTGFVMYGVAGRSWVSMGDPIGPADAVAELAWNFREMVDRNNGWPVFYEVGPKSLHLYIDMGLTLLKVGEEARVPLTNFSLEGSQQKELRYVLRKLAKEGCTFEVIPKENVADQLPTLRAISNDWLKHKNTREKGFSLGFFDDAYLRRFPAALVRQNGRLIAFANILATTVKEELSIDLMRFHSQAAPGAMDFLFVNLMLWGKAQGYLNFSLGMAPLSGLQNRPLAPLWNRLGAVMFQHGDHFYHFEGLRQYKAKFHPEWEPRYIACPGGVSLPGVLFNIAKLISGGLKGIVGQ